MPKCKAPKKKIRLEVSVDDILSHKEVKTIRVLDFDYEVRLVKKPNLLNAEIDFGGASHEALVIQINQDNHLIQRRSTLIHEALHVLDHKLVLGLSEDQIRRLETGVHSLLVDNGIDLSPFDKIVTSPEDFIVEESVEGHNESVAR